MKKSKILEYYEGTPDTVRDYDNERDHDWRDSDAIAFGYFPISIDGSYEFLSGSTNHLGLSNIACGKLFGKALHHISSEYFSFVANQCYSKSYGLGRLWTSAKIITFWMEPTKKLLEEIVLKLNIDPHEYLYVYDNNLYGENETVYEHLKNCNGEDDGSESKNEPFRIDPKIRDIIDSYNETEKTWQVQKERSGWDTMARRNAMIYQEGKKMKKAIKESFRGDPDTIEEFDDVTNEIIKSYRYSKANVISFGYFQTSLDNDEKEFIFKENESHSDICDGIAKKIIGKAISSENIDKFVFDKVATDVYTCGELTGRIFLDANIITTWSRLSSSELGEIIDLLGGLDKWGNLDYIIPATYDYRWNRDALSDVQMNVTEYIKRGISGDNERPGRKNLKDLMEKWIIDEIVKYNAPSSALAAKTAKLGNMTIAQYNSLIHQEGKKSKKTIKENTINMKNKGYKKEFSNYISIMKEALERNNFDAYNAAKDMLEESIEECKHNNELAAQLNTNNFGILNHIFEERLPELFKNNKKAVREVIKTIKEDKNLSAQFDFYENIRKYKGKITEMVDPIQFLSNFNSVVEKHKLINKDTIIESNKKLRNVLKENNVVPTEFIDEEYVKLYNAGHNILTKKQSLKNMMTLTESIDSVKEYMNKHKDDKVNESVDPQKLINDFENKLKETLTESEISFVKQITDWRSPIAEQRKEKLFNKFKNECIDKINEMLKEDSDNSELKGLNDQINEMKYNKETIVTDIAKLLEIRDILLDE